MNRARIRTLAMLAAILAVAAACSSGHASLGPGLGLQAGAAGGVTAPTTPPTTIPTACEQASPTRSLRPTGPQPPPSASFVDHLRTQGYMTVGVDQTTYLFGYFNPRSQQIEGFEVELLQQVAKAIFGPTATNTIHYRAITSAQRIPYLQDGTVDIVARTMTINCQRWQQVDFSTDYYDAGQRVLVPTISPTKSIDELGGKRVCATTGSTSIDNIKARPSHPIPVPVPDWTDCLVLLQQGKVDAISTDDTILAGLAAQDPYVKVVGDPFTREPYGMAIRKDHPDFVRFVNGVLDQLRADGTWTAIYNRWAGRILGAPDHIPPALYSD